MVDSRFNDMLARGYEPGKMYGASPLCWCARKPEHLVRSGGSQLVHLCEEHYAEWVQARAEGR